MLKILQPFSLQMRIHISICPRNKEKWSFFGVFFWSLVKDLFLWKIEVWRQALEKARWTTVAHWFIYHNKHISVFGLYYTNYTCGNAESITKITILKLTSTFQSRTLRSNNNFRNRLAENASNLILTSFK